MSDLREAMERYLALRRSLGFQLNEVGANLRNFVSFAEDQDTSHITVELILRWVKERGRARPSTQAERVARVRRFALWLSAFDPLTEVPPENLLPAKYHRQPPYIYTDEEVERIIDASAELPSPHGLRGPTYSTFFGLIAVTGMRMSETVALDRQDVDLDQGVLTIRRAKFGKMRIVPVHSSTRAAMREYSDRRDRLHPKPVSPGFFLSDHGPRITNWSAAYNFAMVSQQIGLRPATCGHRHGRGPRVHDLRHRFAVRTLIHWYRAGLDVEREIPKLATYLGHVHVNDTYWYLEAVPELLQLATDRVRKEVQT